MIACMTTSEHSEAPERTQVTFSDEARAGLLVGMKIADAAVGSTLGPRGLTVLIARDGMPMVATKDGVTVSKAIQLADPLERMGADLIKEAASRTNDVAGDGTTTATVLTYAMAVESNRLIAARVSPVAIKQGIEMATSRVIDALRHSARPLTDPAEIAQVGTVSANGDAKIGALIADAMAKVGRDGIITVEDAKGTVTSMDVAEGMQFDRGYLSPYFVNNNERMQAVHDDGYVLLANCKLTGLQELVGVLEQVLREQKPLLIVADEVEGAALQTLIVNKLRSNLNVVAIKAPGYGSGRDAFLQDIAVMTGAKIASPATGLSVEKMTRADLGRCKRFVVDAKSTTIVGTGATASDLALHVETLKAQTEDPTLAPVEAARLRERIARLAAGVAVIRVGGATELEMVERKHRIEDALHATRAAVEEGILPGGGTALVAAARSVRMSADLYDGQVVDLGIRGGFDLVLKACEAPLRRIVTNAGGMPDVVVDRLATNRQVPNEGYNASTDKYEDMFKAGIVDPLKVARTALIHAASVVCTFTTLSAVVSNAAA